MTSESQFEAASKWLSSSSKAGSMSNDTKLELYGLFKFINTSAGPTGSRPGMLSFEGRAKYDAWTRIAKEYTGRVAEARARYVEIAKGAGWTESAEDQASEPTPATHKKSGPTGFGPSVSMMEREDDTGEEGSLLHDAASEGDLETLNRLLTEDQSLVNAKDEYGFTPLHLAADRGRLDIVQLLLARGADKAVLDPDGQSALDLATVSGRDEIVQLLQ